MPPADDTETLDRRRVCPLQVFEDQEQRFGPRQLVEQGAQLPDEPLDSERLGRHANAALSRRPVGRRGEPRIPHRGAFGQRLGHDSGVLARQQVQRVEQDRAVIDSAPELQPLAVGDTEPMSMRRVDGNGLAEGRLAEAAVSLDDDELGLALFDRLDEVPIDRRQ